MQNTACTFDEPDEIANAVRREQSYAERLRTLSAFELDQEELRVELFEDIPEARPDPGPILPPPTDAMRRRVAIGDYLDGNGAWLLACPAFVVALWYLMNGELVVALLAVLYGAMPSMLVLGALFGLLRYVFGVKAAQERCRAYDYQIALLTKEAHTGPELQAAAKLAAIKDERRRRVADRSTAEHWLSLRAGELERAAADLFAAYGHDVERTGGRGDLGADLILRHANQKILVQCKGLASSVGPDVVRELVGAKLLLRCNEAWLVAPNGLSDAAHDACRKARVRYLTASRLSKLAQALAIDRTPA